MRRVGLRAVHVLAFVRRTFPARPSLRHLPYPPNSNPNPNPKQVATKMIRPGNTNQQVTSALGKVAETFGVNLCAGVLSHQMKRCVRVRVRGGLASG